MKIATTLLLACLLLGTGSSCKVCSKCKKTGEADVEICNKNNQNEYTYRLQVDGYKNLGYTCTEE